MALQSPAPSAMDGPAKDLPGVEVADPASFAATNLALQTALRNSVVHTEGNNLLAGLVENGEDLERAASLVQHRALPQMREGIDREVHAGMTEIAEQETLAAIARTDPESQPAPKAKGPRWMARTKTVARIEEAGAEPGPGPGPRASASAARSREDDLRGRAPPPNAWPAHNTYVGGADVLAHTPLVGAQQVHVEWTSDEDKHNTTVQGGLEAMACGDDARERVRILENTYGVPWSVKEAIARAASRGVDAVERFLVHEHQDALPAGANAREHAMWILWDEDAPQDVKHVAAVVECQLGLSMHIKNKGRGVIAAEDLAAGTYVATYYGEVLLATDFNAQVAKGLRSEHYALRVCSIHNEQVDLVVDAKNPSRSGWAGRINSGCGESANLTALSAFVRGSWGCVLIANRDIRAGEELMFTYNMQTTSGAPRARPPADNCFCMCGDRECKSVL